MANPDDLVTRGDRIEYCTRAIPDYSNDSMSENILYDVLHYSSFQQIVYSWREGTLLVSYYYKYKTVELLNQVVSYYYKKLHRLQRHVFYRRSRRSKRNEQRRKMSYSQDKIEPPDPFLCSARLRLLLVCGNLPLCTFSFFSINTLQKRGTKNQSQATYRKRRTTQNTARHLSMHTHCHATTKATQRATQREVDGGGAHKNVECTGSESQMGNVPMSSRPPVKFNWL